MPTRLGSLFRKANKTQQHNILTCPTHERYESNLSLTGHNFYAYRDKGIKDWNANYAPIPDNYNLLPFQSIPLELDFDLVLSQQKFGQFQALAPIASQLGIPLISLEHTLPIESWTPQQRLALKNMRGNINVFISEYSVAEWGFDLNDPSVRVIKHCVDNEIFKPTVNFEERENVILSVVNDWINRDYFCGFHIWERVSKDLPVKVLGDTPGLSKPASIYEVANANATSRIFLNTSTVSPIPTALLEAMSCGCAVVSTATCMIPEVIKNGYNGFISNDEKELRSYCEMLIYDVELAKEVGDNARKTILTDFTQERFIKEWNDIFYEVTNWNK